MYLNWLVELMIWLTHSHKHKQNHLQFVKLWNEILSLVQWSKTDNSGCTRKSNWTISTSVWIGYWHRLCTWPAQQQFSPSIKTWWRLLLEIYDTNGSQILIVCLLFQSERVLCAKWWSALVSANPNWDYINPRHQSAGIIQFAHRTIFQQIIKRFIC